MTSKVKRKRTLRERAIKRGLEYTSDMRGPDCKFDDVRATGYTNGWLAGYRAGLRARKGK